MTKEQREGIAKALIPYLPELLKKLESEEASEEKKVEKSKQLSS